ncbi:MAG TPA: putative metal-binding motif-containing protein [Myxococcaceae bacterium]|nr:putative metal-binding motif-containing protein [Myxococcaceae bacterium]
MAAVVSCNPTGPAVLRVHVLVDPGVAATCVVLQVNGGPGGEQRQVRGAGAVERDFVVERGTLDEHIQLKAGAGVGTACADPLVFSVFSQEVDGAFSASATDPVALHLTPPTPAADRDGDGFASTANGGADCDDADPSVHPGAKEVCLEGIDADCDGLVGCADPDCAAAPCAPAAAKLAFASGAQSLEAGQCSAPVIVRAVTSTGAVAGVPRELPLTLQLTPTSSLGFFVDAACTVPMDEAHLGPGTQPAQFHVQALTGGSDALQVSADGFASSITQSFAVKPMVMKGSCPFPLYETQVSCPTPLTFDPAHALLVFQATNADNTPSNTNIACSIASGRDVTCSRDQYAVASNITWQVLRRAGLTVQHLQPSPGNYTSTVALPTAVASTASTFLLTSTWTSGSTQGDNDFRFAQLTSPTTVAVSISGGGGGGTSIQVVEWPGSSVTRGITQPMYLDVDTLDVTGLPPVDLARSFLTYGWRTLEGGPAVCNRSLRGELTSPTSIRFHRGDGNPACANAPVDAIGWERVQLPTGVRVQSLQMALAPTFYTGTALIAPADPTRSLLFAGGQFTDGQAAGEGSYNLDDVLGEMHGAFTFDDRSHVRVTRAQAIGSARWNVFAVEVPP